MLKFSRDPYKILGITTRASMREVNLAFKKMALETHPDRPGGSKERFQEVNEAYQRLTKLNTNTEGYAERSSQERAKKMKRQLIGKLITLGIIGTITFIAGYIAITIR